MVVVDNAGNISPVASQKATMSFSADNLSFEPHFSGSYNALSTATEITVASSDTITLYTMGLPLADNGSFKNKSVQLFIETGNPDSSYLSYTLSAEMLASANNKYGDDIYNWIGGRSYTFRINLDDMSNN